MVTAKGTEIDTVVALEVGADDYVTKPFRMRELVARIRAVSRRSPVSASNAEEDGAARHEDGQLVSGEVTVDPDQRRVYVRGEEVKLRRKEFDLLTLLVENAGRVLTRDVLIDRVWGSDYIGDTKTLDVHIKRLRTQVERNPAEPVLITTVRGVGYRFAPVPGLSVSPTATARQGGSRATGSVQWRMPAVECTDLVVRYGRSTAVDRLSLTADFGEVVAVLGPNGAGKTSTIEALEGYRRPVTGSLRVLGLDPHADHRTLVPRIGVMLQRGGVYPMLGPRRALELFAGYYAEPEPTDALLELVGLRGVERTPWRHLSGGEQQRLSLALALVGRPEVLFLDEPTAGVDPEGRIGLRSVISGLREHGRCVVLTTHELGEAERMADRLAVIRGGRLLAQGTAAQLAGLHGGGGVVRFSSRPGLDTAALGLALGAGVTEEARASYRVDAPATPAITATIATWLAERDAELVELRTTASLEETYLSLVGTAEEPPPGRSRAAPARPMRPLLAQVRAETWMTLRRGETLLVTIGIPLVFVVFFSEVHVLPTAPVPAVTFVVPGILALAVMSTAMVSLGSATGFERGYGVLKRLGATPLRRDRLVLAKITTVIAVELLQAAVLVPVGLGLGWRGAASGGSVPEAVALVLLGSCGLRRPGPPAGGRPAGRGQPGRSERPLPGTAASGRHARPVGQAARWPRRLLPGAAGGRPARAACTPRSGPAGPSA